MEHIQDKMKQMMADCPLRQEMLEMCRKSMEGRRMKQPRGQR